MIAPDHTDFLLFGERTCSSCGKTLPACSDFFAVDKHRADGLTSACRACRNRSSNEAWHRRNPQARTYGTRAVPR
jgi:hypothetical protein